jgi:hypothetical protein
MEKFQGIKIFKSFEGTHNSKRPLNIMKETVQFIIAQMDKNAWDQYDSVRNTKTNHAKDQVFDIGAPLLHKE